MAKDRRVIMQNMSVKIENLVRRMDELGLESSLFEQQAHIYLKYADPIEMDSYVRRMDQRVNEYVAMRESRLD